ncbi:hypothetical protein [Neomoorella humiferrea]|uniref:Uncharacterized protein n=1 Tax=Neomoorella humiferrea TaxID=676965 RepID=A0A2T0ANB5_9FIRM|nr:hypothetical protein [Moorella humiferrea]PRR70450.1 hypothetical protein MOHU_18660 [Moorella humiferrea]
MNLLQCCHLSDSDRYFEELLAGSADLSLLGNIELNPEELDHLAKLIAGELGKPDFAQRGSLSVAVFLVGMGVNYYHDNFWAPVYTALGLPPGQIKWQRLLGEAFLATVEKYNLPAFSDELRYIMPILAHGIVPNAYLNDYFSDVVLAIYYERERAGLPVMEAEIAHLATNWRRDYHTRNELERELAEVKGHESSLALAMDMWKNKEKLERLQDLRAGVEDSVELKAALAVPEGWLEQAEAERSRLQQQIDAYYSSLKHLQEIAAVQEAGHVEINALNRAIEDAGKEIMGHWDDSFAGKIEGLPVDEINKLAWEYTEGNRVFVGSGRFWVWLLRLLLRRRYRQVKQCRQMLEEKLDGLPVRSELMANPWPALPKVLRELQQLLRDYHKLEILLENLRKAEQGIFATSPALDRISETEIALWQERLTKLNRKIAEYKMNLVRLGKGDLEEGLRKLSEQRSIRCEIETIVAELNRDDIDSLVAILPLIEKYPEETSLFNDLIAIREKENNILEKLKTIKEPLYFLNESTRIFILQGGNLAEKFVFHSLLLMQKLDKGEEPIGDIVLPSRIIRAMEKWWYQQGKDMLDKMRSSRGEDRESYGVTLRRPVIKLDTIARSIKVEFPEQTVGGPARATLVIRGKSGTVREVNIPVHKVGEGQYRTGIVDVNLEPPEPVYHFEFRAGEIFRSWKINGIDGNNACLLFSSQRKLIEDERLPEDGAYLVAPAGSRVMPVEAVKEQERLTGSWSDYEYWYLDLDGIDAVLVRNEKEAAVFKKLPEKLEPGLLGGEEIVIVKTREGPVYRGKLPMLLFSKNEQEELRSYGVRLDWAGVAKYVSLDTPGAVISKDDIIFVPLAVLFGDVYGVCGITLIYRESVLWHQKCVVVPDLTLEFDRVIYSPQDGKRETGRLELSSRHYFTFFVRPPAQLVESSPGRTLVEFDTRQNQIVGQLGYSIDQDNDFRVEVYIDIPAVRWRGSADTPWKAEVEEIWHEELGEIEVKLPACISGMVKLALDNGRQVISRQIRKGVAVFNLRQLSDTLGSDNLPVHDLYLSFQDSTIPACLLVRVRMRWQVADISIVQRLEGERRIVVLAWQDFGVVTNRIVRLWPLGLPGADMLERRVPDGVSKVEIREHYRRLPAGGYRLQFTIDDPWEEDEVLLPDPESENCIDVMLGDKAEILQDILQNGLLIESFACEGEIIPAGRLYWIQDIAIKPEFLGEERFQGNICTVDEHGNTIILDCNPVSFYLDLDELSRLPFLIDRDRDGATYCKRCRVLFWEIAHQECGRQGQVILPEYIFVQIRRGKNGPGSVADN